MEPFVRGPDPSDPISFTVPAWWFAMLLPFVALGIASMLVQGGKYVALGAVFSLGVAAFALFWAMTRFEVVGSAIRERFYLWWKGVDLNCLTAATIAVKGGPTSPNVEVLRLTDADGHHYTLNLFGAPKGLRPEIRAVVRRGIERSNLAAAHAVAGYLDPAKESSDMIGLDPVRWRRLRRS